MKLNKFKGCQINVKNILTLKLTKNKIDSKNIISIKNNLKIISLFIENHKKVVFIGDYTKINIYYKTLLHHTNFRFLPTNLLQHGFFSNIYVYDSLFFKKNKEDLKFLFNFQSLNYDLIVLFENESINYEVLKVNKIPVVFLCNTIDTLQNHYTLKSLGLLKQESDVFYFLIYNIFKKYKAKVK